MVTALSTAPLVRRRSMKANGKTDDVTDAEKSTSTKRRRPITKATGITTEEKETESEDTGKSVTTTTSPRTRRKNIHVGQATFT